VAKHNERIKIISMKRVLSNSKVIIKSENKNDNKNSHYKIEFYNLHLNAHL
jgi:hypothetical protein